MIEFFQTLLVKSIPFIIPATLLASWLVNHKTPESSNSSEKKPKPKAKSSKPSEKESSDSEAFSEEEKSAD